MELVSSLRLEHGERYDYVHVWNRGARAGVLTVTRGDGVHVATRLADGVTPVYRKVTGGPLWEWQLDSGPPDLDHWSAQLLNDPACRWNASVWRHGTVWTLEVFDANADQDDPVFSKAADSLDEAMVGAMRKQKELADGKSKDRD